MASTLSPGEAAQLAQTIEMFEVITQSQPADYQSLEILKEAYSKLGREKDAVGTSKKIAQAYVQMGQLSSAILEYETILQRCPGDGDVQAALKRIESKASSFPDESAALETAPSLKVAETNGKGQRIASQTPSAPLDEGRRMMYKVFVETRTISANDFELCWTTPTTGGPGSGPPEPFIQILAERGILPFEKSLRLLCEKSRCAYLSLSSYDVDIDLARTFPADVCRRWWLLPFDRMSKSVLVATTNPFNQQAAKELGAATPNRLLWYLVPPLDLVKYVRKAFR
jgi:tetratricopeptide (TPR) repeat protein